MRSHVWPDHLASDPPLARTSFRRADRRGHGLQGRPDGHHRHATSGPDGETRHDRHMTWLFDCGSRPDFAARIN